MNLQDMLLGKLAEIDEGGFPYKVHLNCIMNQALQCPESVRESNPNQVVFTLASDLSHNASYDWETRMFSFYASFGGVTCQVVIPAANIGVIVNDWDNTVVSFGKIQEQQAAPTQNVPALQGVGEVPQSPKPKMTPPSQQPKPLYTLKHLSLVVDNT